MATDKEILLKLKLDKQQAEKELSEARKRVDELKKSLVGVDKRRKEGRALNDLYKKSLVQVTQATKNLTQATATLSATKKTMGGGTKTASADLDNMAKASGAATSSVLELGRVIQDAPYGMRGMGNNITQLASQMAFATKSAGSFGGALRAMGASLMGPTGLILVISAVVSAMEMFDTAQKKAQKSTEEFNSELDHQVLKMKTLAMGMDDMAQLTDRWIAYNFTGEDSLDWMKKHADMIDVMRSKYGLLDKKLEYLEERSPESVNDEIMREHVVKLRNLQKVAAEIKENNEEIRKLEKWDTDYIKKNFLGKRDFTKLKGDDYDLIKKLFPDKVVDSQKVLKYLEKLKKSTQDLYKEELDLENFFKVPEETGKGRVARTLGLFKAKLLDFQQFIASQNAEAAEKFNELQATRLHRQQKAEEESLLLQYTTYVNAEQKRVDDAKKVLDKQLADKKITQEQHHEAITQIDAVHAAETKIAQDEINEAARAQEQNHLNQLFIMRQEFQERMDKLEIAKQEKRIAIDEAKRRGEKGKGLFGVDLFGSSEQSGRSKSMQSALSTMGAADRESTRIMDEIAESQFKLDNETQTAEKRMELQTQISEFEDKLLAQQKKRTDAKLLYDKLERDSKTQVLMDTSSILNSLSSLMSKDAKKNKALAIASTTISTFVSAQKAYESQIIPLDPTSVPRAVVAASAAILQGLARVKAIQNTSEKGTSAPASGGGGGRTFDFNLVGSTRQDQLAQSIGGKFDEPVRAYVVGNDISSRQELDNKIKTTATI